jgi:hypothetical protein
MPTVTARVVVLALLALLLVACASKSAKQGSIDAGPPHEVFATPPTEPTVKPTTGTATKPAAATPAAAVSGSTVWPFVLTSEGTTFEVHQPVVETWDSGVLTASSVVVAQPGGQADPVAGSIMIKAVTEVDSAAGIASLVDTEVLGVNFPAGVDKTEAWREFLRFAVPPKVQTVPAAALESGRNVAETRERAATTAVPAPHIIVSERPAVLVYIDGTPRYVAVKGTNMVGVLNTRVLLLKDPAGIYYLHLYDGWVRAAALDGPWEIAPTPPDTRGLLQAARESGRANLLVGKADANGKRPVLSAERLPVIHATMQPTALIVTDGLPRYAGVVGTTTLEYAVNSSAPLFRDTTAGDVYVRVDGFWFRAANLPVDFSAVPGDSSKRDLNVVAADPRTATLSVSLDGDPVLEPIRGTQLNYVANASVPIIQIDIDNWYAVQNGVWFRSTEATGPWTVTNRVPPQIYAIPPGVPIYHAIHSRVMASSTDVTYYGYPGAGSHFGEGGATGVEEEGGDYQYTPPSGMSWGWFY